AKGGNNKQRYSSFKIKEIGKKEEESKALIIVDTLVDWTDHDEKASTTGDAGEFALMGVTSEVDLFSIEPKPNDSTSCASTSSVSTSENDAEIESNIGTPIQET
nr:hypothetical protein [Tanacetum cinerariifolium]